jgi:two-component system, response regulator / RNA-binding antiterminator
MRLRVLLADSNSERASALEASLAELGAVEVVRAAERLSLSEAVASQHPDVVIVDMARPDRDGLDAIREMTARNPRPVVMFVDEDDPSFMEEAITAGVSSYNVVGAAVPDVKPIVRTAVALFRRFHQIETDLRQARASLEERTIIDRAKSALMRERGLAEPEAYRLLRSRAMNESRRIVDIAREILSSG